MTRLRMLLRILSGALDMLRRPRAYRRMINADDVGGVRFGARSTPRDLAQRLRDMAPDVPRTAKPGGRA